MIDEKVPRASRAGDRPSNAAGPLEEGFRSESHDSGETAGAVNSRDALNAKAYLLRDSIAPLDSYTEDGVYWADLPYAQRVSDQLITIFSLID
jgi:hypothetical protein